MNSSLLPLFFGRYEADNSQASIQQHAGFIEQHQGKKLVLYLNEALNPDTWAQLLDSCKHYQVHLELSVAPGVALPEVFLNKNRPALKPQKTRPWSNQSLPATAYIQSSDRETTLALMQGDVMIEVSEVEPADLFLKIDGHFDKEQLSFHFSEEQGALPRALKAGKRVILKGRPSADLRNFLTDFLLKRQQGMFPEGQLLMLDTEANPFHFISHFRHEVTLEDKKGLLPPDRFSDAMIGKEALTTLMAIARHPKIQADASDNSNAWEGLRHLPPAPEAPAIELSHAKAQAEAWNQARLRLVTQGLEHSPYIFLAGMTGVGKTSFIHDLWKKAHPVLHFGESQMQAWALDSSEGIKTLFIDEANLSGKQWSQFEGLFYDPPGILIGNTFYALSKDHKVIFAGNPLAYGGERQLPALFARHGNSIVFNPIPWACLYETLLKALFDQAGLKSEILSLPVLEVNQFLTALSSDKVLLSPRELGMMALLTISYCQTHPKADPLEVVQYYAYTLAQRFVPESAQAAFKERFEKTRALDVPEPLPENFIINSSNRPLFNSINGLLDLRRLRQQGSIPAEGGLGGLVVEGEPGCGKTALVAKTLVANGIKKGNLHQEYADESVFYLMPVSMSLSEKESLLIKAFYAGAVVVIDEINSAPMMERLLNDLLMGKLPPGYQKQNPDRIPKPGFMVLATQNPPTLAGRSQPSAALDHRLLKMTLPHYSREEMTQLLLKEGLDKKTAGEMIDEYLIKRGQKDNPYSLCLRDLLKRAREEVLANKPGQEAKVQAIPSDLEAYRFSF